MQAFSKKWPSATFLTFVQSSRPPWQRIDLRIHGGLAGLEGAENLPSLRNLNVFDCTAADLSPLAGCIGLETFSFSGLDGVEDFSALSALPRLHGVLVPQARVGDIAADCPGAAFAITGQ